MYVYEVVVGIDFGSSGTGYAYSFNNPKKIDFGKFYNNYIIYNKLKVPTLGIPMKRVISLTDN